MNTQLQQRPETRFCSTQFVTDQCRNGRQLFWSPLMNAARQLHESHITESNSLCLKINTSSIWDTMGFLVQKLSDTYKQLGIAPFLKKKQLCLNYIRQLSRLWQTALWFATDIYIFVFVQFSSLLCKFVSFFFLKYYHDLFASLLEGCDDPSNNSCVWHVHCGQPSPPVRACVEP